jgi:hypothetical protein
MVPHSLHSALVLTRDLWIVCTIKGIVCHFRRWHDVLQFIIISALILGGPAEMLSKSAACGHLTAVEPTCNTSCWPLGVSLASQTPVSGLMCSGYINCNFSSMFYEAICFIFEQWITLSLKTSHKWIPYRHLRLAEVVNHCLSISVWLRLLSK